ncbi:hypothetical protein DFH06DRAFT_1420918 [Mycena polygramma]|nr:hypothetical protein DFH06DRAFT_1420918 [Mycena polygramma]
MDDRETLPPMDPPPDVDPLSLNLPPFGDPVDALTPAIRIHPPSCVSSTRAAASRLGEFATPVFTILVIPDLKSVVFDLHIFFTCPAMSPPQASARRAPVYDDLAMLDPEVLRDGDNFSPSVSARRAQLPPPLATTPAYPYDDLVLVMLDQNERFILHASVCPASFTVAPTAYLSLRCSRRCTSIVRYLFPALHRFLPRRRPPPPKTPPLPHSTRRASPLCLPAVRRTPFSYGPAP